MLQDLLVQNLLHISLIDPDLVHSLSEFKYMGKNKEMFGQHRISLNEHVLYANLEGSSIHRLINLFHEERGPRNA